MNKQEVDKTSWNVFDEWYPPKEKDIFSWAAFDNLLPIYKKILEKKYKELTSLLKVSDSRLSDLGGDPSYYNWEDFRPLRLSRE